MTSIAEAGPRGGRGKCRACASDQQDAINRDLAREVPYRTLEKRYGITKSALFHHKQNHLSPALVALHKADQAEGLARPILDELRELTEHANAIRDAARRSKNASQALSAIREARQNLELRARITGELDERPQVTVNLQTTQEWIAIRTTIFEVLEPFPELAAILGERLQLLEGGAV